MKISNLYARKRASFISLFASLIFFSSCAIETGNPLATGKKPKKLNEPIPSEMIKRSFVSCSLKEESFDKKSAIFSCELIDETTKSPLPLEQISNQTQWSVSATPEVKVDPLTFPQGSQFEFRLSVLGDFKVTTAIGKVKLSVAATPMDTNTPINVDRFTIKTPDPALWDFYLSDETWDTFADRSKLTEISYSCVESPSLCSKVSNAECGIGETLPYIVYFAENRSFLMVKRRKNQPLKAHQFVDARFKEISHKFDPESLVLWIENGQFFQSRYFKCSKGYKSPANLPEETN
jgi:hypothetical protein